MPDDGCVAAVSSVAGPDAEDSGAATPGSDNTLVPAAAPPRPDPNSGFVVDCKALGGLAAVAADTAAGAPGRLGCAAVGCLAPCSHTYKGMHVVNVMQT